MMDQLRESQEFEVLGFNVRFKAGDDDNSNRARDIVEFVSKEAVKIKEAYPGLDNGQVAVLLALKMANDNMKLSMEYQSSISELQKSALDALQTIEEISPSVSQ
ncbi:MAG: cell division protein ZapA [Bacteriovoracaceae bacterium]